MFLYMASISLATLSVFICFFTSMLCFMYPRRSVFLFNVAFLLLSDGLSSFTFVIWSLPRTTICSCEIFLPLQNFLFLHSFACTMLIARRFKQANFHTMLAKKEKWYWLYTFVWSLLFNAPLMFVNYFDLHDYPEVSAMYYDSHEDNFDFCYYASNEWAFMFNMVCLILPCLLALSYNIYCFKTGLKEVTDAASKVVIDRERETTHRYLGALVAVWLPTIVMNLIRYFSKMGTYTFINIIVILTSMQGILHTAAYVMTYRPLRRHIGQKLCGIFNFSYGNGSAMRDTLVHHDDDEDEKQSPLAAYDINTYVSPLRSSISGKSSNRHDEIYDRPCSGENFVKFGAVQYQVIPSRDSRDLGDENISDTRYNDEDEAEVDTFNTNEHLTPVKKTKVWRKLVKKLTPPFSPRRSNSNVSSLSAESLERYTPPSEVLRQQDEAYLKSYYSQIFHQAHE